MKKPSKGDEDAKQIYKTYTNERGTYSLTKDEFDVIVAYFRKIKLWRDAANFEQDQAWTPPPPK